MRVRLSLPPLAALAFAGSVLTMPAIGVAQSAPAQGQAAASSDATTDISHARAEERAGYATHDPAKIAAARQKARSEWHDAYVDTHPRACEGAPDANGDIAKARAEERAAYATHDPAKIAAARQKARSSWHDAYMDTHQCGKVAHR